MKICVISNDTRFARMLELELSETFGEVKTVTQTLDSSVLKLEAGNHDVIVFDADYYKNDLSFLENIKNPTVVLSYNSVSRVPDNVKCVVKRPFLPEELVGALNDSTLDESGAVYNIQPTHVGAIEFDHYSKQAKIGDLTVKFSPKEFSLLCLLYKNRGKIVPRKVVLDTIWGKDYDEKNNVDNVYINYLRKKIDEPLGIKLIHTIRNKGYLLSFSERK